MTCRRNGEAQAKRRSLDDIVQDLMAGDNEMKKAFVVGSIRSYAQSIVAAGEPAADGAGFISEKLWYQLAKEILGQLDQMFKENAEQVLDAEFQIIEPPQISEAPQ
jgi:hypothetical protein